MNRYPIWKYAIIVITLLVAVIYTLPNLFGESPAVQVSAAKVTTKVDAATLSKVEEALKGVGVTANRVTQEGTSVLARFDTPDDQLKAKDAIERAVNPNAAEPGYVVALNLVSRSPAWLASLNAKPMYLGLDLRGGVHFMLQVDMDAARPKRQNPWRVTCAPCCGTRASAMAAMPGRVRVACSMDSTAIKSNTFTPKAMVENTPNSA